jgi:hypothetical protein
MNTIHEYKTARIGKRSGNSARRGYKKTGYYVSMAGQPRYKFKTLKEAKLYVDLVIAKVGA